jgi:uncharacterized repeat protein (TIGR01451 family)
MKNKKIKLFMVSAIALLGVFAVANATFAQTSNIVSSRSSSVSLNINGNNEIIRIGDIVEYTVNYKNISTKNLQDVILRVSLPQELKFIDASRGYLSSGSNTLIANIENIAPQAGDNVHFKIRVDNTAKISKATIITANLLYTNADNTQEEIFAYTKNFIEEAVNMRSTQGATAILFGGNFLPNTLIGWLLLILLLSLVILAVRKAYYGREVVFVSPANSGSKKGH